MMQGGCGYTLQFGWLIILILFDGRKSKIDIERLALNIYI